MRVRMTFIKDGANRWKRAPIVRTDEYMMKFIEEVLSKRQRENELE